MKVKTIKKNDLDVFRQMSKDFYMAGATMRGYDEDLTLKTFDYLTSAHHNLWGYFILTDDGVYAGYALLTSYWCNEEGGEIIILDEIYIGANHRNQGYGRHFLAWVEKHFHNKATNITLEVLQSNDHAVEFYKNAGYSPDGFMTMTKKI